MKQTIQNLLQITSLPALETRMLLQLAAGLSRTGLISHSLDELNNEQVNRFNQLIQRRINGEPMAYITGQREFYGRNFTVSPDVLIPRPDTETLIEVVLEQYSAQKNNSLSVLDLGTGSGVIAITIALEHPTWKVFASDISSQALSIAKKNSLQLNAKVDFQISNWLHAFKPNLDRFDLIISNPPYIDIKDEHLKKGDLRFEPTQALTDGADGLTNYRHLIDTVPDYLKDGGQLWFEHGYDQAETIRKLLENRGFINIQTFIDLGQKERVTSGQYLHSNQ